MGDNLEIAQSGVQAINVSVCLSQRTDVCGVPVSADISEYMLKLPSLTCFFLCGFTGLIDTFSLRGCGFHTWSYVIKKKIINHTEYLVREGVLHSSSLSWHRYLC